MWIATKNRTPPENQIVETKIDNEKGLRKHLYLVYHEGQWWQPDMSVRVHHTPTYWKE